MSPEMRTHSQRLERRQALRRLSCARRIELSLRAGRNPGTGGSQRFRQDHRDQRHLRPLRARRRRGDVRRRLARRGRVAQAGPSRHQPHLPDSETIFVADGTAEYRGRAGLWARRGGAARDGRIARRIPARRGRRPAGGRSEQRAAEDARSRSRARHPAAAVAARRTRRRAQPGGTRLDRRAHQGAGASRNGDHRGRASHGHSSNT